MISALCSSSAALADASTIVQTTLKPKYNMFFPVYNQDGQLQSDKGVLINTSGEIKYRGAASFSAGVNFRFVAVYLTD